MILRRLAAGLIRHLCAARVTSGRDFGFVNNSRWEYKNQTQNHTHTFFATHKKKKKISKKKKKKKKKIKKKKKKKKKTQVKINFCKNKKS